VNIYNNFCAFNRGPTALTYIDFNTVAELQQTFPQPITDQRCSEVTLCCPRGSMCPSQP